MWLSRITKATARVVRDARINLVNNRKALVLTPSAVDRVKELLAEKPGIYALKIGLQQRGCNGFTYTMDYAEAKGKFDEEVVQDGIRIWVDPKAQLSLLGSEMDYVSDRLTAEFVFRNPNITSTCGCGESFNV
uniref:Iron-sulfur cluster assembly 1 homolog, mitochondrial n=1 Tax=Ditylenchus dipsaci TaxID=166011 RepID=A0A915CTR3_9BILA